MYYLFIRCGPGREGKWLVWEAWFLAATYNDVGEDPSFYIYLSIRSPTHQLDMHASPVQPHPHPAPTSLPAILRREAHLERHRSRGRYLHSLPARNPWFAAVRPRSHCKDDGGGSGGGGGGWDRLFVRYSVVFSRRAFSYACGCWAMKLRRAEGLSMPAPC